MKIPLNGMRKAAERRLFSYRLYRGVEDVAPTVYANNAVTLAFPKEGKVARECVTDEDVGTCFMGKCLDVRLYIGVYHPL